MKSKHIKTGDGSSSLYLPRLDEHYHSIHGALRESQHVYVQNGLCTQTHRHSNIRVLEFGFGTALNALTTLLYCHNANISVQYNSIEKYPLAKDVWSKLNYCKLINRTGCDQLFEQLHECPWDRTNRITSYFQLKKIQSSFEPFRSEPDNFHVVYFDVFAPDVQPELWSEKIFQNILLALKPGGTMTTYSSKGAVKRTLKHVGFEVEKIAGPPGKREMLRAFKPQNRTS